MAARQGKRKQTGQKSRGGLLRFLTRAGQTGIFVAAEFHRSGRVGLCRWTHRGVLCRPTMLRWQWIARQQIIVAAEITQPSHDKQQLVPMLPTGDRERECKPQWQCRHGYMERGQRHPREACKLSTACGRVWPRSSNPCRTGHCGLPSRSDTCWSIGPTAALSWLLRDLCCNDVFVPRYPLPPEHCRPAQNSLVRSIRHNPTFRIGEIRCAKIPVGLLRG